MISSFLSLLLLLVSVAFFTLMERKVLAYIMLRRGPNKPSLSGLFIPLADALKLLTKPFFTPSLGSILLVRFACILFFLIPSLLWLYIPLYSSSLDTRFSLLSILVLMSLTVYALLSAGWGSNSKYSTLGSTRCIAQCISYEVCLTALLLCFCLFSSFNLLSPRLYYGMLLLSHLIFILFVVILAETNRSPFDFAEGESELVSGFNVEYSGPGFVVIFISEYLSIMFMSFMCSLLALDCSFFSSVVPCVLFCFLFIWVRGTLPRFRYDQLMSLCWKSLLPSVLSSFMLLLSL